MSGLLPIPAPGFRAASKCLVLVPVLLIGCKGGDKADTVQAPPDITGKYNVLVNGTTGCSGVQDWINGWAPGAMSVEGDTDQLTFDFGDGLSFTGSISADYTFAFSGSPTYNSDTLETYGSGTAAADTSASGGAQWVLSGDLEVKVKDPEFEANDCTITGTFDATELIGA